MRGVNRNDTVAAATSARTRYGSVAPAASTNIRPGTSSGRPIDAGGGSSMEVRHREPPADGRNISRQGGLGSLVVTLLDRIGDQGCDRAHLVSTHAPRGLGRCPDADPRRRVRRLLVERDLVLVDGDPDLV